MEGGEEGGGSKKTVRPAAISQTSSTSRAVCQEVQQTALFLCAGRKCFLRCIARFERKRSERVLISGPVPMLKRTTLAYGSGWRGRERRRR